MCITINTYKERHRQNSVLLKQSVLLKLTVLHSQPHLFTMMAVIVNIKLTQLWHSRKNAMQNASQQITLQKSVLFLQTDFKYASKLNSFSWQYLSHRFTILNVHITRLAQTEKCYYLYPFLSRFKAIQWFSTHTI